MYVEQKLNGLTLGLFDRRVVGAHKEARFRALPATSFFYFAVILYRPLELGVESPSDGERIAR